MAFFLLPCGHNAILLASALTFLLTHSATAATDYTVGDDSGWTTGINYLTWSQEFNFTVGDVLVFRYVARQHDVFEVTEATYRSCNSSSGVIKAYATGRDQVTLAEARKYWFICNVSGHCLDGMKFGITVAKSSSKNKPTPSPLPPASADGGAVLSGGGGWACWLSVCILILINDLGSG